MKRPIILICATALASAAAQNYTINVATTAPSGDKIRGPVTVKVTGVNGLRQRAVLSTTVTYPAGPSLSGIPFIPPIPSSQAQSNGAPAAAEPSAAAKPVPGRPGPEAVSVQPPDIGGIFRDFVEELNKYELQRVDVQNAVLAVIRQVNRAKDAADALVATSDAALAADSTGKRLTDTAQALHGDLLSAIRAQWPDDQVAALAGLLAVLNNNLAKMQSYAGWTAWATNTDNRHAYDMAVARVSALQTLAAAMDSSTNANAATMKTAQAALLQWDDVFQSLSPNSFQYSLDTTCTFALGGSKETKVVLSAVDRFAPAGTAASTQEIVTAVCSSPISISGGFGISTLKERDIDLIQSSKKTTDSSGNATTQNISVFGYKGYSSFHPLPLLLVNVRVHEWNDIYSLHVSGGAAVDIKTGATAGANAEYVGGLSLGVWRSFFITTAFHAGRVPQLTGGYSIGQEVPTGVSTAPVENRWRPGFAVAFTYKLR